MNTTRPYVAPWVQMVTCPQCGDQRPISARHQNFFDRATRRTCRHCQFQNMTALRRPQTSDGPTRPYAQRYQPDNTVIDWVVVDRLTTGHLNTRGQKAWRVSTRAERVAAVAAMTARGMPATLIADRMGVSQRTVVRLRATIREEVSAA